jgi:hypothetical protein
MSNPRRSAMLTVSKSGMNDDVQNSMTLPGGTSVFVVKMDPIFKPVKHAMMVY